MLKLNSDLLFHVKNNVGSKCDSMRIRTGKNCRSFGRAIPEIFR